MSGVSYRSILKWTVLASALVLLNLSLTFVNVWPTLSVRFTADLSLEAAALVLAFVAVRRWLGAPSQTALRGLGATWVLLVIGRYADVTARSLYGRELNLYWDLRHVPDVSAMLAFVAEPWQIGAVVAGAVLLPLLVYTPLRWALGCIGDASNDPWARRVLIGVAGSVLVFGAAQRLDARVPDVPRIADSVTPAYIRQARQIGYELSGAGMRALPPPVEIDSNLAHVGGADVFLIFVESYGVVSWDQPALAEGLVAGRARLEADIAETGRRMASARVESTTFGGESWLAHISLLTGTEVRDQDINVRLMTQQRDTLVTLFSRKGYRTVTLMPGLQRAWPEGEFYGFDETFGALELGYRGPPFGWWDVNDQFALARLDSLVADLTGPQQPLFVFFPTISTHTPFVPAPPYQPDWERMLTPTPYDTDDLDRAWSQWADWLDLGPSYVQALDYMHATVGGYLRRHAERDLVVILIGDHQPPAAVSGADASWDVPVHVIASRPAIVEGLLEQGFGEGLEPGPHTVTKIHALLPILLNALGER